MKNIQQTFYSFYHFSFAEISVCHALFVTHGPKYYYPGKKKKKKKNTATTIMHKIRTLQYQHDQEIGTMARLAATSSIAARRSAIKLDSAISHDRNSVLILCMIVVAVFFLAMVVHADMQHFDRLPHKTMWMS